MLEAEWRRPLNFSLVRRRETPVSLADFLAQNVATSTVEQLSGLKGRMMLARATGRIARSSRDGDDGCVSGSLLTALTELLQRQIPLLLLYGTEKQFYRELMRAREGRLGTLLGVADSSLRVELIDGVLHGFTSLAVGEAVLARTEAWLRETFRFKSAGGA